MKPKIQLVTTKCRRCGKQLVTTNRAIHGADVAKKKWDSICTECITPDEQIEMLEEQAMEILKNL